MAPLYVNLFYIGNCHGSLVFTISHGSIHGWGTTFGTRDKGLEDYVALDLSVYHDLL